MPLDLDAVGRVSPAVTRTWTSKDALLYAVGVGAGRADPLQELAFTTENSHDVPQQVLPTFGVMIGGGGRLDLGTYDPAMLVHGEQSVTVHQPIPPEGTVQGRSRVVDILDKGKAAVVVLESTSALPDGSPLVTSRTTMFIRGEGGFGGHAGADDPWALPERAPDVKASFLTSPDQALVYRLSGDRNPLHSDPWFAARGGFPRPILHGLCTYGITGRLLLAELCGGDAARFRSMSGRFSSPVFPGEELTVHAWEAGDRHLFTVTVGDRVVLTRGVLESA